MKKVITLALVFVIAVISVQAKPLEPVNKLVKISFTKEFATVSEVNWSFLKDQDLYKASFMYNGKEVNAYFNRQGEYMGTSRYISNQQIPFNLFKKVTDRYKDFAIRTIIEYSSPSETEYYITMESEKAAQIVKVSPEGEFSMYKKLKKP